MKKTFLLLTIAAVALASCSKTGDSVSPVKANLSASTKAKAAPGTGGGGGSGSGGSGGGTPVPVSNLDIYTKQLTAGWLDVFSSGKPVPNLPPGSFGTISLLITLKSDGTFTLVSTDSITGAQVNNSGSWQFTIPANVPRTANGQLVLTSGGTTLVSGWVQFVRPGILRYDTTINHLDQTINLMTYMFQKA